jgi:hypothetical protein
MVQCMIYILGPLAYLLLTVSKLVGFPIISNHLTMNVPNLGIPKDASNALNTISTFLFFNAFELFPL